MKEQLIELLSETDFNLIIHNRRVKLYTLCNNNGCKAQFTNYGARWLSFWCKDNEDN